MVQTQALNRLSGGSCCHLRLCFLINFVHPWPLLGTECFYAVRIFYCEIKWQRLSYPKTRLLLILPRPDGEMEPPFTTQQGLLGAGKVHLQAWQTLCGLRGWPSWGMSRWAIHRSQRSSLSMAVCMGPKSQCRITCLSQNRKKSHPG